MKLKLLASLLFLAPAGLSVAGEEIPDNVTRYVDPFVGSTNFGTTNPGAVCPNGLMSVSPFNVMGSSLNVWDKDSRWWSTPYCFENKFFTGYSHVNLSGVGCPELGALLVMPTAGPLQVDYHIYGSEYSDEYAEPGYYSNVLSAYGIRTEVSATTRTSAERFTFPAGESHILLNLGEGLTNETGAMVRKVSDTEIEGMRLLGTFCYNPQAVFPMYFVMRVSKTPVASGYWKKQRVMTGVEAEWTPDNGKYKIYTRYGREMAGDDIGYWFTFETEEGEQIEVQMGVSFVSIENARENLEAEQKGFDFDAVRAQASARWERDLSKIRVSGGTEDQKTVFYTGLYHALIHPNILNDVNGEYPLMENDGVGTVPEGQNRYTVFSLWDTYRNVHQLMTLLYPDRQLDMVRSMIGIYKEWGWMPKWELYGRETFTMEGDPAIPVIADTWFKGLKDFDIETAYQAFIKSATTPGAQNRYYIADHALSLLADSLGHAGDAARFKEASLGYRHYYCPEYGTLRPLKMDGTFYSPFDPRQGENFETAPGFHEGSAWNYTFYVPHDIKGLAKLMGGKKKFVDKLQMVFDEGLYDPANEPDIAYPYLFSYFKGEEWRTQKTVKMLLDKYYRPEADGIPGNDDTGTMSAWAVFSMMGFYPDCPGEPHYTLTAPVFDRIELTLDPEYTGTDRLVIEKDGDGYIRGITSGGKPFRGFRIGHHEMLQGGHLVFDCR